MGWRVVSVVAPLVIIESGVPNSGLFVYNGIGGAGNPPVLWAVAPGVTSDPFGNTVAPVFGIGTLGGPGLLIDQFGNLAMAGADGSLLELSPEANLPFALTSALSGVMQTLMTMQTLDSNEVQAGVISGLVLGSGSSAKMGTLITSPYAAQGMGMLLQSQNDGATDTPLCTWGTVTTQGSGAGATLTFQPLMALGPQVLLLYQAGGALSVATRTSGSGTITITGGAATALAEAWAGGTAGPTGTGGQGGGGSGGAEYAAEPALAVGATVSYVVGAAGANSTVTGSAVTVTAHPGTAGVPGGGHGTGGTGSTNTTHHNGGAGGAGSNGGGGGGGGSSAGPNGAGNAGHAGSGATGGSGGSAPSGGAAGGKGGNTAANASAGSAPGGSGGGGGGGGGSQGPGSGGAGTNGQVRVSWQASSPAIMASYAVAAGTDQFGTAYEAGSHSIGPDGVLYPLGENTYFNTGAVSIPASGFTTVFSQAVAAGSYHFEGVMRLKQGAAGSIPGNIGFTGPATSYGLWEVFWNLQGATTTFNSVNITSFGTQVNVLGSQTVAGNEIIAWYRGNVTFTASGTFVVGCQADGTHAFTAQPGCELTLRPVG